MQLRDTAQEVHGWRSWKSRGWSSTTAAAKSWTASPSRWMPARSSGCSARMAQARPPPALLPPDAGRVPSTAGASPPEPMYNRARLGMGYLSQESSVFRKLTVEKNILAILEALPQSRSLGRKLKRSERWERTERAI